MAQPDPFARVRFTRHVIAGGPVHGLFASCDGDDPLRLVVQGHPGGWLAIDRQATHGLADRLLPAEPPVALGTALLLAGAGLLMPWCGALAVAYLGFRLLRRETRRHALRTELQLRLQRELGG